MRPKIVNLDSDRFTRSCFFIKIFEHISLGRIIAALFVTPIITFPEKNTSFKLQVFLSICFKVCCSEQREVSYAQTHSYFLSFSRF